MFPMHVFALNGSDALGTAVASELQTALAAHEEREFEDGEHKARPLVSISGQDLYILHSLNGAPGASANDKLMRLLLFIGACRINGARSVTVVAPYLAYSRKDRKTKRQDPVSTLTTAQLMEAVGTDRLVTFEVHNIAAFQNAFRIPTLHLESRSLFVPVVRKLAGELPLTVVSPDGGGIKRAQLFQEIYEAQTGWAAGFAFLEKRRSKGVVSGDLFAGDVMGTAAVIIDDIISSGGTMLRAAEACRARGASKVYAAAAHGPFGSGSELLLSSELFDAILITDSIAITPEVRSRRGSAPLKVVSIAPLIADAIRRLDSNDPIPGRLDMES